MKNILLVISTIIITLFAHQTYLHSKTNDSNLGQPVAQQNTINPLLSQYIATKPNLFSEIAENSVNSIVNIASTKIIRYRNRSPFFNDPFFEHFFGRGQNPFGVPQERRQQSLGSGVIVSAEGHILTNNHVVANSDEITVRLTDQSEHKASVVGTDPHTDLALIKIKLPENFKPLPLGNSDNLRLAETVLAIGSPFGLGGTVTMGIVSAKGRANVGIVDYEDFIQTDAAINPGNSGGALLNLNGELIGINTAIYSKSGGYQGIGFAIPINMAKYVMEQLIKHGKVERGWLGLHYQDITADIAKALKLEKSSGVIVRALFENGPAAKAGFNPGDVIVKYNNKTLKNSGHLSKLLSETPVNSSIKFDILRDGKNKTISSKLMPLPESYKDQRQNLYQQGPRRSR
ncbi:MAG TPA: Do family serine endopeptidase [Oligoflexia bacterium]|nr:Do family serine endopeptidase [Oligoflexia bacterium]HMR24943.1 Do family serine endopeptidase [Oligoflexia bacterium]